MAHTLTPTMARTIAVLTAKAYDPTECDQCEGQGITCWECADDVLTEYMAAYVSASSAPMTDA